MLIDATQFSLVWMYTGRSTLPQVTSHARHCYQYR